MGSHANAGALLRAQHRDADDELRAALAEVSLPLGELLSLWPENRHDKLVLWARLGPRGAPEVGARTREHDFDAGGPGLAREVRRVRGDVPVVIELRGGRTIVLGWRAVRA